MAQRHHSTISRSARSGKVTSSSRKIARQVLGGLWGVCFDVPGSPIEPAWSSDGLMFKTLQGGFKPRLVP
jgi:hypothetical protein